MLFRLIYLAVMCVLGMHLVKAQTNHDTLVEQLMELMADELPEDFDYSELVERWDYYLKHPIDLNVTDGKELKELAFLSPLQMEAIIQHRILTGKYQMTYELQSVSGLNMELVRLLWPFVKVSAGSTWEDVGLHDYLRAGKHDMMFRYGRTLEAQKGFHSTDSERNRYLGSPDRLFLRYRYTIPQSMQVSLNMKKDAGEQFFSGAQRHGFDFYSGSIYLQKRKKWEHIVLGDYTLQFGQGLALWTGLRFGKGALVQHIARQGIGLRPYTSSNEFSFFRGVAATYTVNRLAITPFISYKKLSATYQEDVDGQSYYRSILESGLHRTPHEVANRHNLSQLILGSNLQYQNNGLTLGTNIYHTRLGGIIEPQPRLYNRYVFHGQTLTSGSTYYHHTIQNVYLYGEIAHSLGSGIAYNSGFITSLSHELSIVLHYRNYQKNYHAFYNQAIAEGTNAINEKGFYAGLIFQPSRKLLWVAYADHFSFPWFRYRVDAPSNGRDLFTQLTITPNRGTKLLLRYRYRNKDENSDSLYQVARIDAVKRQQIRLEIQYKLNGAFGMRHRAELIFYRKAAASESGYLVYQDLIYKPVKGILSGNIRFAFFNTDSYNTRIYAFENDVLYASAFPVYHNTGLRYYANVRCKVRKGLDVWGRYAGSYYPSLASLGSGLDQIEGSRKSEIKLQMRLQF